MAAADITVGDKWATVESETAVRKVTIRGAVRASLAHKSGNSVFVSLLGNGSVATDGLQVDGIIELGAGDSVALPEGTASIEHATSAGAGKLIYLPAFGSGGMNK